MNSRTVVNGSVELAVWESGDAAAETVILIHGWPDTHELWAEVEPLLGARFHVVAYDTRGHGASSDPGSVAGFRLAELAADLRAVARAVSPDRPVHLLAHDWGSVQAWEAVCEPDATTWIASFTSVSGPNLDHLGRMVRRRLRRPTPNNLAGPAAQLLASGYTVFFQLPTVAPAFFRAVADQSRWRRFLRLTEGHTPERVHLAETFRDDAANGLRIYRANIRPALAHPRERTTSVPVQLMVGRRDRAVRPAAVADTSRWVQRLWRRDIPAGHWSPFSHPQVLARAVTELADALAGQEPTRDLRRAEVRPGRGEFEGQLVVVTGAGSGIGRETALAFARLGADLALADRDPDAAGQTAREIESLGRTARVDAVDVSDESEVRRWAEGVLDELGVPDVVVNNAGIGHAGSFLKTSSEDFARVLAVNLDGVVHGCRAFAGSMVERGSGGSIVNLSSLSAYAPQRSMAPYATSKAAVLMFSECLRAELAGSGVGVSAICPGIVHTNILRTTTFSGLAADEQERRRGRLDTFYRRRNYPASRVADRIVDAVRHDRAVVPVTAESWQGYYLHRIAPGISRALARIDLLSDRG